MSRDETGVIKVGGDSNSNAYLKRFVKDDKSLSHVAKHRVLQSVKITSGNTKDEVQDAMGGIGVAYLHPTVTHLADKGDPILFVPIFSYTDWTKQSDIRDKDNPMVMVRTFDPNHEVARFSQDVDKRNELYPGQEGKDKPLTYKYLENFRFVCVIHGEHELTGTEVCVTFSGGEYYTGENWCNSIHTRKLHIEDDGVTTVVDCPLYMQVWQFSTKKTQGKEFEWQGFDITNPADASPIVGEDLGEKYQLLNEKYEKLHEAKLITVDDDTSGGGSGSNEPTGEVDPNDEI